MKRGFTIIELLVASTIFIIILTIAVGGFVRVLRMQRAIVALMEANDNASFTIEQMAREIRTGYNFCTRGNPHPWASGVCTALAGTAADDWELMFINAKNDVVFYRYSSSSNGFLERGTASSTSPGDKTYQRLTAPTVRISGFKVVLAGNLPLDDNQPRVTLAMEVGAIGRDLNFPLNNIQTTLSSRVPDS